MKNPKNRETTDRSEMMCPRCQTEGLESHPAYEQEYDGKAALLKATRCSNEECKFHNGVPREKVEMQMPKSGIGDLFNLPSDVSVKDALTVLLILAVVVVMAASYGIGPFGSSDQPTNVQAAIEGSVTPFQGEYPEVLLYQDSERITSVQSQGGNYTINSEDLQTGNYTLYANYPNQTNPPGQTVEITGDSQQNTVNLTSVPQPLDVNLDQNAGRSEISLNYRNPTNIRNITLGINPIEGESVERSRTLSQEREQNILMPVFPASQRYSVNATYTRETINTTGSYRGQPASYEILGNADAERIRITLPEETETNATTRTVNVPDSGITETFTVASEETIGPAEITIRNGTSEQVEQTSGTWDNEDNITIATGTDEFVQGTLQIEPSPVETEQTIEGSISGTEINHQFSGNMPIDNATIEFTGGETQASQRGGASVSVNAENGSTGIITDDVATVSESGSYRFEWTPEFTQNNQLVDLFYEINGERTSVNSEGTETLGLEEGDTVSVGGEAQLDTMVDDTEPPSFSNSLNSDLEVTDIEFSNNNPEPGDQITVSVTIENTGVSEVTDTVELYQNKELVSDERISLSGGEQTTLGLFEFGEPVVSNEPGLEVWRVNQRNPEYLRVGIDEKTFGVGQIEGRLLNVGTGGTVSVDTSGDGNLDCEVSGNGGVCEFEQFESGENTFTVQQDGISGTSYIIDYISQENPTGVKFDVGGDGIVDLSVDGVLEDTVSEPVELPPNEAIIEVESDNQIPIEYGLSWQSNAVVNNPVVYVDGDLEISDEGSFVEGRTYQIGTLSQGEHEVRFQSSSGGYEAEIKWREEQSQAYPQAVVDNNVVCEPPEFANNLTCVETETGVSPGQHTLNFRQTSDEIFNYRVEQDARAVASNVEITVNGQTSETFTRPDLQPEPWETVSSTTDFIRGSNNVTVSVEEENGIVPEVTTNLQYLLDSAAVERVNITVTDAQGNTNTLQLPEDESRQIQQSDVKIPADWLSVGSNTIRLDPEPTDGVFEISGNVTIHEDEQFTFDTLG